MAGTMTVPAPAAPEMIERGGGWNWWQRLSVGKKIGLGYMLVLIVTGAVIALGAATLRETIEAYDQLARVGFEQVRRSDDLETQLQKQIELVLAFLLTDGDEGVLEPGFSNARAVFEADVKALREDARTAEEQMLLTELQVQDSRYVAAAQRLIAAVRAGRRPDAEQLFRSELDGAQDAEVATTDRITEAESRLLQADQERLAGRVDRALSQLIGAGVLVLLLGVVAALISSRAIASQIASVTIAAERLRDGDLAARAPIRSADEVGMMARAFNLMADRQVSSLEAERSAREYLKSTVTRCVAFVNRVAEGDLTGEVDISRDDELGMLGRHLNGMVGALRELSGQLREAVASVGAASAEILAAVAEQSASGTEQAAAIAETSATVEEVKASAEQAVQAADGRGRWRRIVFAAEGSTGDCWSARCRGITDGPPAAWRPWAPFG